MKYFVPYVFVGLLLLLTVQGVAQPRAIDGRVDLTQYDFRLKPQIHLTGYWQFYEGALIQTFPPAIPIIPTSIKVPDEWKGHATQHKIINGFGVGSYRLLIEKRATDDLTLRFKDIGSAYRVWLNGKLALEAGKVDTVEARYVPTYGKQTAILPADTNLVDVVIEVANFSQIKGGIKTNVDILPTRDVWVYHEREALIAYSCLGIILMIGFFHLFLFGFDNKELSNLNFGLFCFTIFVFLIFRNRVVYSFAGNMGWETGNTIEFVAEYVSLPLFYRFFNRSFPKQFGRFFMTLAWVLSVLLILFVLTTDMRRFSVTINYFHLVLLLYIVVVAIGVVRALLAKEGGIHIIFPGFIIFISALVNDILHVQNIINTANYAMLGVLGFIISQALFLAWKSVINRKLIVSLSQRLTTLNESLKSFVPSDFLKLLGKQSITDVTLGNRREMELTIMFSDIRAFTAISEKLSPTESFDFINDYLSIMAPIISKHNGFIDKYVGDGIMALFPRSADDAVLAGKEMLEELTRFNQKNKVAGKPQIAIGIGLHTGSCILGTVGEPKRMDTTVIADSVNLAARIEALTKFYKTPFIISRETFNQLSPGLHPKLRYIGDAMVKGKSIKTQLYKVFLDHEYDMELLNRFDQGIAQFYAKHFQEAAYIFNELLPTPLNDGVLHFYLGLCDKYHNQKLPEDWTTFQTFEY